jgi:hypothetical protein
MFAQEEKLPINFRDEMITSAIRRDSEIPQQNRRGRVVAFNAIALAALASMDCSTPHGKPVLTSPQNGFSGIADAAQDQGIRTESDKSQKRTRGKALDRERIR